jgi:hypothetical protein
MICSYIMKGNGTMFFSKFRLFSGRPHDDETLSEDQLVDDPINPLQARGPTALRDGSQWTRLGALLRPLLNPDEARDVLLRANLQARDGGSLTRAPRPDSSNAPKPGREPPQLGQPDVEHPDDLQQQIQPQDDHVQIAAAGDLRCRGFSGGCSSGGSYGTSATNRVFGRPVCTSCAIKMLSLENESIAEQLKALRIHPLK